MARVMLEPLIGDLKPGMSFGEPCAGSGGMLLAAAEVLRSHGFSPDEFLWVANDVDPVATALLAVNAHLWELGHGVLVGCADSLAEPDWMRRAWEAQCAAIRHRDDLLGTAAFVTAIRQAETLLVGKTAETTGPLPCPAPPAVTDVELPPGDGTLFTLPGPAARRNGSRRPAPRTSRKRGFRIRQEAIIARAAAAGHITDDRARELLRRGDQDEGGGQEKQDAGGAGNTLF